MPKLLEGPDRVVFLDIDGPMISHRALLLRSNMLAINPKAKPPQAVHPFGVYTQWRFDPVAVCMMNRLFEASGARLVVSSSWAMQGLERVTELFDRNEMLHPFHEQWRIPAANRRATGIVQWLEDQRFEGQWAAIDDDASVETLANGVVCTFGDGFLLSHYLRVMEIFNIHDPMFMGEPQ